MTIEEIFEELGYPTTIWENAMGEEATAESFYLYELHLMSFDFWENQVWIFNSTADFGEFAYALELFDYLYCYDDPDFEFDESDQTELYNYLCELKNREWTLETCQECVAKFHNFNIEIKAFLPMENLLKIEQEEFEKCKAIYLTLDQLEEVQLTEATYKILHRYSNMSKIAPSENREQFLEFISNW